MAAKRNTKQAQPTLTITTPTGVAVTTGTASPATGLPAAAMVSGPVTVTNGLAAMAATLTNLAQAPVPAKPAPTFTKTLAGAAGGFKCGAKYGGHVVTPASKFALGKGIANLGPQGSAKEQINGMLLHAVANGHAYAQWVAAVQAAGLWAPVARPTGGTTYPAWHLLQTALGNGWLVLA